MLRAQLHGRRIRLNEDERRRLAVAGGSASMHFSVITTVPPHSGTEEHARVVGHYVIAGAHAPLRMIYHVVASGQAYHNVGPGYGLLRRDPDSRSVPSLYAARRDRAELGAAPKPGGRLAVIDFPPQPNSDVQSGVPANWRSHGVPPDVVERKARAALTHVQTISNWRPTAGVAVLGVVAASRRRNSAART